MALNTPNPQLQVTSTTSSLATKTGAAGQIVVDTTKQTLVVMDGATNGGHPLAKEAVKIKSASPNLKINGGTEANLGGDITITNLPGYVPTGMSFVKDPEGQPAGKYLKIDYTDENGDAQSYYINGALLEDNYQGGDGIDVSGTNVISVKLGTGLKFVDGKLTVDLESLVDTDGPLSVEENKLKLDSLVSADEGNNLKEGTDKLVYYPSNLGTL